MDTIRGKCSTNLDDYQMIVTEFYRVPNVGERVSCLRKGELTTLRVVQITHSIKNNEPFILIELHN